MTISNAGEDVEKENSHSLQAEMKNSTVTFKDSVAVSYKSKHSFTHAFQQLYS